MKVKDILIRQKDNPNTAIVYGDDSITYKGLYSVVNTHMSCIKNYKHNRNVGVFFHNSIDYAIAYFTVCCNDDVIIPLEDNITEEKLKGILKYCEISLIITNSENVNILRNHLKNIDFKVTIYNINDKTFTNLGIGEALIQGDDDEDDVCVMLHTSGTTSDPKKVMLTNHNLISNIESNVKSLNITSKDVCLIVLPMFFGYCNSSQFLSHLYLGAKLVIYKSYFMPRNFLKLIESEKCTNTTCVPSMLFLTIKSCRKGMYDLSSLRYLCFGGGTMPVDMLEKIIDFFENTGIVQTYGQTEASPRVTCLLPEDAIRKIGSVGKAIPNVEVQIFDDNDNPVKGCEVGQIVVKGPNVMKGYYKKPDITKETLKGNWLHTGDLGHFDDEGYLYIVGRIKNIIISGGLNIYPEEIEEVMINYPEIKEVVVVPEHHDILGEVPIAKIVPVDGADIDIKELNKFCVERLSANKIPSKYLICDKLEKTYTGKIKRS